MCVCGGGGGGIVIRISYGGVVVVLHLYLLEQCPELNFRHRQKLIILLHFTSFCPTLACPIPAVGLPEVLEAQFYAAINLEGGDKKGQKVRPCLNFCLFAFLIDPNWLLVSFDSPFAHIAGTSLEAPCHCLLVFWTIVTSVWSFTCSLGMAMRTR
jgi:hypothetical protein